MLILSCMLELTVKILSLFAAVILVFSLSCSNDDEVEIPSADSTQKKERTIIACYGPNALGDLTYGDSISLALNKTAVKHGLTFIEYMPSDRDKADECAKKLISETEVSDSDILYVFCDSSYRTVLEELSALIDKNNKQILLIDSREVDASQNIHTVCFSFYGMAYEAGVLANELIPDSGYVGILIGDQTNSFLQDAVTAFKEGLRNYSGAIVEQPLNEFIGSDTGAGYNSELLLYGAYTAFKNFAEIFVPKMILPLCGGSIHGIFRFNRDWGEDSPYTIGIDRDMSAYTNRVPYSLVKHFDKGLERCVQQWINGSLPHHQRLGLAQGFTELVISPGYQEKLQKELDDIHKTAIEREEAYEKENYEADK